MCRASKQIDANVYMPVRACSCTCVCTYACTLYAGIYKCSDEHMEVGRNVGRWVCVFGR